jgi:subfamily B ATP-binding cassette protein MsbA
MSASLDRSLTSVFSTWSRCLYYLKGMYSGFFIAAWASILVGFFTVANAQVLKTLFDGVLLTKQDSTLLWVTFLLVFIYAGKGVASFIARHTTFLLGSFFAFRVRQDLFRRMVGLPMTYFEAEKTGQILSRFTLDVAMVQNNTNVFYHAVKDISSIVAGVVYVLWVNASLAMRTFFVLPMVGFFATRIARRLRTLGKLTARQTGDVTSYVQESVVGIHEIQSFSAEERMATAFDGINAENKRLQDKAAKYQALATPIVEIIVSFGLGWVIWSGSGDVMKGNMTPGEFLGFLVALGLLFEPMRKLADLNNVFNVTKAHADRFLELIDHPVEITEPEHPRVPEKQEGRVEFREVGFRYAGTEVDTLQGVCLEAQPGDVIALVGSSGAGKSTLVKLLPRFYDTCSGEILIDGVPIRDYPLKELRKLFGIVPQETVLFSGSVAENIAFGVEDASEEDIRAAALAANALEFIEELDSGFETEVGERGVRLSGGQKQRIAIARAIMKDPRLLILDEATSSLDSESERLVQEALERLMKSRTTFVIAHRLSTIQKADRILVLSGGRVVERGTHRELLQAGGEYSRLSKLQLDVRPEQAVG